MWQTRESERPASTSDELNILATIDATSAIAHKADATPPHLMRPRSKTLSRPTAPLGWARTAGYACLPAAQPPTARLVFLIMRFMFARGHIRLIAPLVWTNSSAHEPLPLLHTMLDVSRDGLFREQ